MAAALLEIIDERRVWASSAGVNGRPPTRLHPPYVGSEAETDGGLPEDFESSCRAS